MSSMRSVKTSQIKTGLALLLAILVIFYLAGMISKEVAHYQNNMALRMMDESFGNIRMQLEQHGLNQNLDSLVKPYSKLFNDNCNVVVTDDGGKILYKLNEVYLPETDAFHLLINPWKTNEYGSDLAYVMDSANNLKFTAQSGTLSNPYALRQSSLKNPLAKELFNHEGNLENTALDREIKNRDGSIYMTNAETTLVFDYSYVASKKMHLFAIYDSEQQGNNFFLKTEALFAAKKFFHTTAFIGWVVFWLMLPIWVYRDAASRGKRSYAWAFTVLMLNLLGLALYLMSRGQNSKVPNDLESPEDDKR